MLVRRKSSRYINECQQCQYFWYEKCSNKYITLLDTLCNNLHSPRLYVTFQAYQVCQFRAFKFEVMEKCPSRRFLKDLSNETLVNIRLELIKLVSVKNLCCSTSPAWSVKTIEKLLEAIRRPAYLWSRVEAWSKHNEALTSWYVSIHDDGFSK